MNEPSPAASSGVDVATVVLQVDYRTGELIDIDRDSTRTLGWEPGAFDIESFLRLVHRDDIHSVLAAAKHAERHGTSQFACRLIHRDGTDVLYNCRGSVGMIEGHAVVVARNAADLKKVGEDLSQMERLAELANDLFIVSDRLGLVVSVNQAALDRHGVTREQMLGSRLTDYTAPGGTEILADVVARHIASGVPVDFVMPALDGDGQTVMLEGITQFDEATQRWYTVERDVTDRVERERELAIMSRLVALSASQLAVVETDGTIRRSNSSFCSFVGLSEPEVEGRSLTELLFGERPARQFLEALTTVQRDRTQRRLTVDVDPRGEARILSVVLTPDTADEVVFFSSRDITEEKRLADELLDRATHDQLTRLATREVFNETLDGLMAAGYPVGVIMLDIDDFKNVNDSLGHSVGDQLLSMVAGRLLSTLRTDDLVARFGGDEFMVLLRGVRAEQDSEAVAEKIRRALADPYLVDGRTLNVTSSLGVAVGRSSSHSASELLREADAAAYQAKRDGRNRSVRFGAEMASAIEARRLVEADVREGFDHDAFEVDLQGIFGAADRRLCGVEALARLPHDRHGRVGPTYFLDVVGRLGLLNRLGESIRDKALSAVGSWLRQNPHCTLGLNVSQAEIAGPTLIGSLEDLVGRHDIAPGQLTLELTESAFVSRGDRAARMIAQLAKAGFRIAIDDFGAGTSSLGHLRELDVDVVKIDTNYVHALVDDPVARTITRSVIEVATNLGIGVIAEGVETDEQLMILQDLGVPMVQGYLLHRPEPIGQFCRDAFRTGE